MGLFDRVKASITPAQILEGLGYAGKKYGQGERYGCCPVCGVQSANVFSAKLDGGCHCFQCGFSGSVIDLYAAIVGKGVIDAAKELSEEYALDDNQSRNLAEKMKQSKSIVKESSDARNKAIVKAIGKLQKRLTENSGAGLARRYLTEERGIHDDVLNEAEKRGIVGYLPSEPSEAQRVLNDSIGIDLLSASGLLKQDANMSAVAYRPLVFFLPAALGAEFRLIRPKKNKEEPKSIRYGELSYPYWWQGQRVDEVLIVEGAVDMLSLVSLGQRRSIIALPGCQSWKSEWIGKINSKYGTKRFVVGLDLDKAGEESSQKIAAKIIETGFEAVRLRPSNGCKDWNEQLKLVG